MSRNGTPSEERPERSGDEVSPTDEQWEEFLRHAERGTADAPKEPSARARMVTGRLRALDEEAARTRRGRWRRRGKSVPAEPWQPEGWRTGPAWQEMNGRTRKRRRVAGALGMVVVAGALVVAMRPSLLTDHLPGGGRAADTTPLPAETAPPTAPPPDGGDPLGPTREEPFRGSPALRWADGAQGIEIPEAKAVGGLDRDQVAYALRMTKQLLVEADLDPATLRGERPGKALELLDPLQEGWLEEVERGLREPTRDQDPLTLFTRFDPDEARLLGEVVKTRGRMTFEAGKAGSVEVHADYTFVYPLVKAGGDDVTRTIVRRRMTTAVFDPARWVSTRGKLSVLRTDRNVGNSACDVYDGFLHPTFPGDAPGTAPDGSAMDPYDRSEWLDDDVCGTVTRT
ncbi:MULTISPECIES: hypothetical protein [unclassified Streptomyces]|uniref:hypothetical protein n=1 Tax=unclassified Streptomyces TaxID=2593676 RepID=UPI0001C1A1E6|nr:MULTISPECIES: hypothetical protein [unclassified Streptomyces]MYR69679.1 hypothetical protein [Streptomyces sp. SID4939]MYS03778.1 hypothetical protein [Streptomyces sp. SID4940]MYT65087.1 hypothetical protein [Streptomyces sp. SID8357]MYT85037.1 hypothetical protein [Streptomyces sp. SID8360]MYW39267.1 hypothetical protein [Streptomyces sp. SID1]